MAKKKKAQSQLPSDTTPSLGSNYGLDGYDFYDDLGEGVLDGARLPESRGLSTLPGNLTEDDSQAPWGPHSGRVAADPTFADGPNLADFVSPSSNERLPDLAWLELAEQDPERLPKSPHGKAIPELVEAWGVNRRTNGLQTLTNNKDLSLAKAASPTLKGFSKEALLDVIRRAGRESAAGLEWSTIVDNARFQMRGASSKEVGFVSPYIEQIRKEHGLAGRIFIRADFYPGYESGKWTDYIRKTAHDAFYLVKRADAVSSIHDQEGRCGILKKKIVASIPWKKAHKVYRKKFASAGIDIPDTGNPQTDLRSALSTPEVVANTTFPIQASLISNVSYEESVSALQGQKTAKREKLSHAERDKKKERRRLEGSLQDLVASRLINKEAAESLLASKKTPQEILRKAMKIAQKTQKVQYSGFEMKAVDQSSSREEAKKKQASAVRSFIAQLVSDGLVDERELTLLKQSGLSPNQIVKEATTIASRRSLQNSTLKKAQEHVRKLASQGLLSEEQVTSILQKGTDAGKLVKRASAAVLLGAKDYSGASFTEAQLSRGQEVQDRNRVKALKLAKKEEFSRAEQSVHSLVKRGFIEKEVGKSLISSSKTANELMGKVASTLAGESREYSEPIYEAALISRPEGIESLTEKSPVLEFLYKKLDQGLYGSKLDSALKDKFSKPQLKKDRGSILEIRNEHEGLAGHLYIRALTHDEGTGTKGCTKGAETHRGDNVQYLLGMRKCQGCVFKNPEEVCQKYNKLVVETPPVSNLRKYQQEVMENDPNTKENVLSRLMREEEVSSVNPVQEFGLKNSSLNDFSYSEKRAGSLDVGFGDSLDDLESLWSK